MINGTLSWDQNSVQTANVTVGGNFVNPCGAGVRAGMPGAEDV